MFDGSVMGTLLGIFCLAIAIGYGLAAGATLVMLTKVNVEILLQLFLL
jgi:hypothetical protein